MPNTQRKRTPSERRASIMDLYRRTFNIVAEVVQWSERAQKHERHLFEVNPDETVEALWWRIDESVVWGQHDEITLRFATTLGHHAKHGNYEAPQASDYDKDAWVRAAYLAWKIDTSVAGNRAGTFREHLDKLGLSDVGAGPAFSEDSEWTT